jgi:hypothetical protein
MGCGSSPFSIFNKNPEQRAPAIIVDGMEKDKYHIFVGQDSKMMDFLTRLIPERAAKIIYSQMRSLLK